MHPNVIYLYLYHQTTEYLELNYLVLALVICGNPVWIYTHTLGGELPLQYTA